MVRVLLSHSSKDKLFVRDLADAPEAGGEIKIWLDEREIDYGQNIVLKIEEGLDANVVLLILSPDSVDSKWVKEDWTAAYGTRPIASAPSSLRSSTVNAEPRIFFATRSPSTSPPTSRKAFARLGPGSSACVLPRRP
jgi:hypothetical protein